MQPIGYTKGIWPAKFSLELIASLKVTETMQPPGLSEMAKARISAVEDKLTAQDASSTSRYSETDLHIGRDEATDIHIRR